MCSVRSPHLLVAVAGYALGALALYSGLPQEIPPSWSVPGRGAVWLGAPMVAFLLPTAVVVTDALLRGLSVRHPVDETSAVNVLAVYDAIMLRFMVFVVGVHATVLAGLLGMLRGQEWAAQIVPLMLGFTVLVPVVLVSAALYEHIGAWRDRRVLKQIGRSVDIGGRTLNIYCTGEGSPTVIFVSARTAPGYVWTPTQRGVSAFTRACWYDRG
jgi:hypothetical protein